MHLYFGESAVSANLVSPILIIIVAITAICSFAVPDFSLGFTLRICRFIYIILGYIAGFLGIAIGLFLQTVILCNSKSFGVSYLAPYIPTTNLNSDGTYFVPPMWHREKRADFLNTKYSKSQEKISMKWKF